MNDVDNATSAGGPTPALKPDFEEFAYLTNLMRQLQVQKGIELATTERQGIRKKVPIDRSDLNGEFVINSIKEGYSFEEANDGLYLVKDEKYMAMVVEGLVTLTVDENENPFDWRELTGELIQIRSCKAPS